MAKEKKQKTKAEIDLDNLIKALQQMQAGLEQTIKTAVSIQRDAAMKFIDLRNSQDADIAKQSIIEDYLRWGTRASATKEASEWLGRTIAEWNFKR